MVQAQQSVPRPRGAAMLAAAGILWGGAGAVGRMLAITGDLSSWQVAAGRALVGGGVLVIVAAVAGRPWLHGTSAWRHVLVMAALTVVYQAAYFGAVAAGPLSLATLLTLGSAPVLVTLVHAVTHRRIPARSVGVLLLALTGLLLLVGSPGGSGDTPVLVALSLLAGCAFAAITMVNAGGVPGADLVTGTGVAFVLAGASLAAVTAILPVPEVSVTPATVGWLLVLGLACTAAPYALYFAGLLTTPAHVAALFALLEPLTGTLIAVSVFGETLGVAGWVGAGLLLAAVAGSTRSSDVEASEPVRPPRSSQRN